MAIEPWDPFREMTRAQHVIDRMMEEAFRPWGQAVGERFRSFPVDVYQTDADVFVKAALPGVRPEDVDVSVSGKTATITAERKETKEVKTEQYLYQELGLGRFTRQITLPTEVQTDKADATFEHGVLNLRLPKAVAAKATHLKVKAAATGPKA